MLHEEALLTPAALRRYPREDDDSRGRIDRLAGGGEEDVLPAVVASVAVDPCEGGLLLECLTIAASRSANIAKGPSPRRQRP